MRERARMAVRFRFFDTDLCWVDVDLIDIAAVI